MCCSERCLETSYLSDTQSLFRGWRFVIKFLIKRIIALWRSVGNNEAKPQMNEKDPGPWCYSQSLALKIEKVENEWEKNLKFSIDMKTTWNLPTFRILILPELTFALRNVAIRKASIQVHEMFQTVSFEACWVKNNWKSNVLMQCDPKFKIP